MYNSLRHLRLVSCFERFTSEYCVLQVPCVWRKLRDFHWKWLNPRYFVHCSNLFLFNTIRSIFQYPKTKSDFIVWMRDVGDSFTMCTDCFQLYINKMEDVFVMKRQWRVLNLKCKNFSSNDDSIREVFKARINLEIFPLTITIGSQKYLKTYHRHVCMSMLKAPRLYSHRSYMTAQCPAETHLEMHATVLQSAWHIRKPLIGIIQK